MQERVIVWDPDRPFELGPGQLSNEWTLEMKEVAPFRRLVVSWNSKTFLNTSVEVWIRIRTDQNWSRWFSYGKWTTDGNNTGSFSGQKDTFAKLDIDELSVVEGDGDAIQVKLGLSRKSLETESPEVRRIYASLKHEDTQVLKDLSSLEEVALDVPSRSQLIVDDIGNVICSPTSLAMTMAYYGVDLSTEEVSKGTIDNGTSIYGNWSYNVAYAGECGFDAYVKYCEDFGDIHKQLTKGNPVIASIRLKDPKELEGAPQAYPSGHLIVIKGLTFIDGVPWVLVNDPAVKDLEQVSRKYRYDQLMQAWKNVIYVVERR